MKKALIYGVLLLVSSLFIFLACQKTESDKTDEVLSTITVTYERLGPWEVDPSTFADHITKIEEITFRDIALDRYKAHLDWVRFVSQNFDPNGTIRRYTVDMSAVQIIEIPLLTTKIGESALIYTTEDTCLFVVGSIEQLINGNKRFEYRNIDGNVSYYSFELNSQEKVGNFGSVNEVPFRTIFGEGEPTPIIGDSTCQQKNPANFGNCMQCAYSECYSSWLCGIGCSLGTGIALGCAAVFALHCANIGNPKN